MLKYKYIYFFILVTTSLCEESANKAKAERSTDTKPQENAKLRRSLSHADDQTPAATGYSAPQYLPAPYGDSTDFEKDCHSCNQIPWIPVVGTKSVGYAQSYEYSGHPDIIYSREHYSGPGSSFPSSSGSYISQTSQVNPKVRYRQPFIQQLPSSGRPLAFKDSINIPVSSDIFIAEYMLPPPINFRIPSLAYGSPKDTYGPPKPNYGPPKPVYGVPQHPNTPSPRPSPAPSKPIYGAPNPQYGPPSEDFTPPLGPDIRLPFRSEYGPPQPQYGPPPANGILPPPGPSNESFPNRQYGPPRPFPEYGPPPAGGIVPPPRPTNGSFPNTQYGPPRPLPHYVPPSSGPIDGFLPPNNYGPPFRPTPSSLNPGYGPPASDIRPPFPRPGYNLPPHSPSNYLPPPNYGPPPVFGYGAPPSPSYGPPNVTPIPVLLPPPVTDNPRPQQESSQFLQVPFESVPNEQGEFQISSSVDPQSQFQLVSSVAPGAQNPDSIPPAVPSDSYGNAVTGESLHYAVPTDTVYSSSSDRDVVNNPPNLSQLNQLQYEFRNFNHGSDIQDSRYQSQPQQTNNVEIQPSVQVADYLASVEHPVSVVQSPLFEVDVKDEHNTQNNNARPTSLYNQISEGDQNGYDQSSNNHESFKLSENPIVVEDTYTASSNINSSFTSSNDTSVSQNQHFASFDKLNDIEATSSAKDEEDLIKKLLSEQGIGASIEGIQKTDSSGNSHWIPTSNNNDNRDSLSTSMVPPAENTRSIWIQQNYVTHSSDSQKPLQIIVPYTTNRKVTGFEQQYSPNDDSRKNSDGYSTLLPTYMPPMSTEESNWSKFLEDFERAQSNQAAARPFTKPTTAVYNIKDLLTATYDSSGSTPIKLPYDVISLQKNIDDWTHQSFSRKNEQKTEKFALTKNIPNNFFSSQSHTFIDSSSPRTDIFDHDLASSNKKESVINNEEIETNMIADGDSSTARSTSVSSASLSPTTTPSLPTARKFQRNLWDEAQVTVSPYTKEKVYLVTPQSYSFYTTPATAWSMAPKIENGRANNAIFDSHKFAVRFEPQEKDAKKTKQKEFSGKTLLKVVYSEWPHIINNLQTTTEKPISSHPLLGSMSFPEYVPPLNFSALETIVGYSKVATVTTTPITPKKDETSESSTPTT